MWLRCDVDSVVASRVIQGKLLRRILKHIQRVTRDGLLVTWVVHDDLLGSEPERVLLEQDVVGVTAWFVAVLPDTDDRRLVVGMHGHRGRWIPPVRRTVGLDVRDQRGAVPDR